jgi:hypothetical protein
VNTVSGGLIFLGENIDISENSSKEHKKINYTVNYNEYKMLVAVHYTVLK